MGFYLHRIPRLIQFLYKKHIWRLPNNENKIFLTFDDGPTPEVTDFVLDSLEKYSIPATFFFLGEQVEKNRDLSSRVIASGHHVANHGYSHLDARNLSLEEYCTNKESGQVLIEDLGGSTLFRPPYGRFKKDDQCVLWSLMAGDFDKNLSKEKCLKVLKTKTRSGYIIVFHDNQKSFEKLKWVLPRYLEYCVEKGLRFGLIDEEL